MIDIWVKLVSNQFEVALKLTRAVFGLGEQEAPVSVNKDDPETSCSSAAEGRAIHIDSQTAGGRAEAATISDIMSFLESADRGATVREIAEHLKIDRTSILPLLKKLVKERRIDELLGRYCVLKSN